MKISLFLTGRRAVQFLALLSLTAGLAAAAAFADSVIVSNPEAPNDGEADVTQSGTILNVGTETIVLKDRAGIENSIPVNRVLETHFEGEPVNLQVARSAVDAGQYEDALRRIVEIPEAETSNASKPIQQDIAFYAAQSSALMALSGHPKMKLSTALSRLNDFLKKNSDSWHYYEANRLAGRVLTADGKSADAKVYYEALTKAPWPETVVEGNVALADLLLNSGDVDGAEKAYAEAMAAPDGEGVVRQKNYAKIGEAKVASFRNDAEKAKAAFKELIEKSDPDDLRLQASIYNAMGEAAERAGDPKGAITAFLHVDLLYSASNAEHITALRHLVKLWKQQLREDRAAEAQAILKERYQITNE